MHELGLTTRSTWKITRFNSQHAVPHQIVACNTVRNVNPRVKVNFQVVNPRVNKWP